MWGAMWSLRNGDTDFMRGPQDGNTFTLIAGNVARLGLIALFPRFALGLGIAAITTRLATYAFSSQVRGAFAAVTENVLDDPLNPRSLKQLELHICCLDLIRLLKDGLEGDAAFSVRWAQFNQLINTPNIEIRNNTELKTADGKTVTSLGKSIIQALQEHKKTEAQKQSPFYTKDLKTLYRLL